MSQKSSPLDNGEHDSLSFKSWNTRDFWEHYRGGSGQTVNLASIGLLNKFRRTGSVLNIVDNLRSKQINLAIQHADEVYRRSGGTARDKRRFSDNDTAITNVTWDGHLFSVGNSTFFRSVRGTIEVNAPRNIVTVEGVMTFEIKDWFKDPFDIDIEIPNAKIYKIQAKWDQPVSWSAGILQSFR